MTYYSKTVLSNILFYMAVVMNVITLVFTMMFPEYSVIAVTNLVLLLAGRIFFPKSRVGQYEPYIAPQNLASVILPAMVTCIVLVVSQIVFITVWGVAFSTLSVTGLESILFNVSAAISESYFLHWGLQSALSAYVHPLVGVIGVPIVAVLLHTMRYGSSGLAIIVTFMMFAILAVSYEYSRNLDVPLIGHLFLNLLAGA